MKEVKKLQELIDREQAGKNICKYCASSAYCKEDDCMVYQGLRDTPTVEVQKHGTWINDDEQGKYICSVCGGSTYRGWGMFDFCPKCGANMSKTNN